MMVAGNVASVPFGVVNAATNKFFRELGRHGQEVITELNNDPDFMRRVANFAISGGHVASTDQKTARALYGDNFFGPEHVTKYLGLRFSSKMHKERRAVTFPETVLKKCRHTHILIAGCPIKLRELIDIKGKLFADSLDVCNKINPFSHDAMERPWYLIRKNLLTGSAERPFAEQNKMITDNQEIPEAGELVYAMVAYRLRHGKWPALTNGEGMRTMSINHENTGKDRRLILSVRDEKLLISFELLTAESACHKNLGIAVAEKPSVKA